MFYYEQDLATIERNAWQAGDQQTAELAALAIDRAALCDKLQELHSKFTDGVVRRLLLKELDAIIDDIWR